MNTENEAHVIHNSGTIAHQSLVSMQRGCPATRSFAKCSGRNVTNRGVSFVVGENATPEAIRKAIEVLQGYL